MDKLQIARLIDNEILSYTDIHFARLMETVADKDDKLFLAASLASSQARFGNVCLDLNDAAGKHLVTGDPDDVQIQCPGIKNWLEFLKSSPVVGAPGEYKPLILENDKRLYLYRYWEYQKKLAGFIRRKSKETGLFSEPKKVIDSLNRLFPDSEGGDVDWQKIAACISVLKKFSVISGGPGTGKTTTVTKILALLIELWRREETHGRLRIYLAAPTGKAAARLSESIAEAKVNVDCTEEVRQMIPDDASTIHRLLGSITNSPYFKYNETRKLPADIVIIDEASMVDIALMSKLAEAIPENAHLILLGDQDQLASVAAGAVLGDICNTGESLHYSETMLSRLGEITGTEFPNPPGKTVTSDLGDCITVLKKSYRFNDTSGIKAASTAVNEGSDDLFYTAALDKSYTDFAVVPHLSGNELEEKLTHYALHYFGPVFTAETIDQKIRLLGKFRVLCAVRKGAFGVENLNRLIEKILETAGCINRTDKWYPGRPVMITKNDYQSGLFNGDIGITVSSEDDSSILDVCFINSDGDIKKIRTYNLPACETVYAMTVHKSQGSEFDSVFFVMPDHDTRVLTRELIYTGITRARNFVEIAGDEKIIRKGIQRKTVRSTGLRQALWR